MSKARATATLAAPALVTALAMGARVQPAAAVSDDQRFTAYDEAAIDLTEEVGWLVRLGGLAEPVPQGIREVPDDIGLPTMSRAEMLAELRRVDADGARGGRRQRAGAAPRGWVGDPPPTSRGGEPIGGVDGGRSCGIR